MSGLLFNPGEAPKPVLDIRRTAGALQIDDARQRTMLIMSGGSKNALVSTAMFTGSGTRAPDAWSMTASIQLFPRSQSQPRYTTPSLSVTGTMSGNQVLCECWLYQESDPVTPFFAAYFLALPGVMTFTVNADLGTVLTGDWQYESGFPAPLPYVLTPSVYYRFALLGQVDPGSITKIVYGRWFTINGGFKPEGFSP